MQIFVIITYAQKKVYSIQCFFLFWFFVVFFIWQFLFFLCPHLPKAAVEHIFRHDVTLVCAYVKFVASLTNV